MAGLDWVEFHGANTIWQLNRIWGHPIIIG